MHFLGGMERNYVYVPTSSPNMLRLSTQRAENAARVMQWVLIALALTVSGICLSMVDAGNQASATTSR